MSPGDSIHESEPYILVEGPMYGDAVFYGKWLLMAAKAEAFWKQALKDPIFEDQVETLLSCYLQDFGMCGIQLLSQLAKNFVSFIILLHDRKNMYLVESFVMMAEMGFFVLTGQRYQMVIPAQLNIDVIKRAMLKFAQTEDEDFLHPEHLVTTMPYAEAKAWQERLRKIDDDPRCADRAVLLDEYPAKQLSKRNARKVTFAALFSSNSPKI
jgi:hypothetical protein